MRRGHRGRGRGGSNTTVVVVNKGPQAHGHHHHHPPHHHHHHHHPVAEAAVVATEVAVVSAAVSKPKPAPQKTTTVVVQQPAPAPVVVAQPVAQPYPAQPYPAQPYPAQPYPAQPYPAGQPVPQAYPAGQPVVTPQPYPAQPYPQAGHAPAPAQVTTVTTVTQPKPAPAKTTTVVVAGGQSHALDPGSNDYEGFAGTMANGITVFLKSHKTSKNLRVHDDGHLDASGGNGEAARWVVVRMKGKLRTKLRSHKHPTMYLKIDKHGGVYTGLGNDKEAELQMEKHGSDGWMSLRSLHDKKHWLSVDAHSHIGTASSSKDHDTHFKAPKRQA